MPTLAPLATTNVVVPAGWTLVVTGGRGTATGGILTDELGATIGPFATERTITLTAVTQQSYSVLRARGDGGWDITQADVTSPGTPVLTRAEGGFNIVGPDGTRYTRGGNTLVPGAVPGDGNALPRYRAALAATAANTADTRIAYLGDSTVAGAYASGAIWDNCRPFCPPVLLGNWLKQNLGLPVSLDAAFGQGNPGVALLYDPRVTRVAWTGLNDGTPGGLGGGSYRNDTNEAASVNFQFSDTFDIIEVDYLTNSGGADFTISINGGAALGATVTSNGAIARATVTRTCTPGAHTVNINRLVGAGFICIFAVRVRSSTTRRVLVWNWGTGGTAVSDWLDTTNIWSPGTYGPALAPHLVLVQLGINDAINAVTNATALTNYQALVDLYRPFADVVFVTPTPVAAGSASLANQRGIVTACRQIATINGCPLIDSAAIFGTQIAGAAAGYFAPANDPVHPGPTGYAAIAEAVTALPGLLR